MWGDLNGARLPASTRGPLALAVGATVLLACGILTRHCRAEAPQAENPVTLRPGVKQLFLDMTLVDQVSGVRRLARQPRKYPGNPVVKPEFPWESSHIQVRDAPLWNPEAQRWELRYFGWGPALAKLGGSCTCLAVSRDGLKWEKPIVGRFEFQGSRQNNLAHPLGPPADFLYHVLYDARDPDPARRWKALIGERDPRPAASPDGFTWKFLADERIPSGEESHLIYDEAGQQFVFTIRTAVDKGFGRHRAVNLSTSKDFVRWTSPRLVFYADEQAQLLGRKWLERHLADPTMRRPLETDPKQYNTQIYNMAVFPYEGLYIGLPTLFRHSGHSQRAPAGDGFSETGLVFSHDLTHWRYVDEERRSFLPLSPADHGAYDTAQIEPPSRPTRIGDELWFFYSGLKYRYSPGHGPEDPDSGAICLATLRLDGFIELRAGEQEGVVLTRPMVVRGDVSLWVNADATGGQMRVEVLDADGNVLGDAWSKEQSASIEGDGVRLPVRWKQSADLRKLKDKAVRLRFLLRNASLYAFWTEASGGRASQVGG